MKKAILPLIVLTLSSLYSMIPFLFGNESISHGQDIPYHLNWAQQVSAGMKEGLLFPRWFSTSNGGYGSPTAVFYSPLFYWVASFINLFIPSLMAAVKITTYAGFLLSGISMYIFLRNFCNRYASAAGGLAFQLMPYHVFDLYQRGALAETFAFFWFPLVLHFAYKGFAYDKIHQWTGMAISYAGLVLTHIASAYIFTFIIAAYALSLSLREKDVRALLKSVLAGIFGLCISAVYFIPMLFERRYVHIEWLTEVRWGDYMHNFLFMNEKRGDTFYLGLEQIVIVQALLVLLSIALLSSRRHVSGKNPDILHAVFFPALFVFSIFISTSLSVPIWREMPGLKTIQFPWRWLTASTLSTSILIGLTIDHLTLEDIKRERLVRIFGALFTALFLAILYMTSLYIFTAEPMNKRDLQWIFKEGGDVVEYRPIWLSDKKKDFSDEKYTPAAIKDGIGTAAVINWDTQSRLIKVSAATQSTLRISTFYYPGWTASISGGEIPITAEKDSGAILISVPPGENKVLLEFRDTLHRKAAKWISIFSLFAAFCGLVAARRKRE